MALIIIVCIAIDLIMMMAINSNHSSLSSSKEGEDLERID